MAQTAQTRQTAQTVQTAQAPVIVNADTPDDEATIDLGELFGYYFSKLALLITSIIIGALIAGVITVFLIPVRYTATARMYMVSATSDSVVNLSDLNLGSSLSSDYVELMKSRPIIEQIAKNLNLDYDYDQLTDMISLDVVTDTRIVRISTTSTDPQEAMDISNELAEIAKDQLPQIMDAPEPNIAEYAVLPEQKSSPSLSRNVTIGALVALLIVLIALTVSYVSDDSFKTADDVEKEFGFMPLAVIPEGDIPGLRDDIGESGSDRKAEKRAAKRARERSRAKNSGSHRRGGRS